MGTAGARFMVAKQVAASGGLFLEDNGTSISLDPGPGAIVGYARSGVDLTTLDAIVLSHRHLDHTGDVNVMVEAMTDSRAPAASRIAACCSAHRTPSTTTLSCSSTSASSRGRSFDLSR